MEPDVLVQRGIVYIQTEKDPTQVPSRLGINSRINSRVKKNANLTSTGPKIHDIVK